MGREYRQTFQLPSIRVWIIHGSSESGAKGQASRPQPTGQWLQGPFTSPMDAHSNTLGLAAPARFYVCGLQACPFAANFHAQG